MRVISKWVERVPREGKHNRLFRLQLLRESKDDVSMQKKLLEACREDVLFYINTFVFTFDPRTEDKTLPFVTYPCQDRAVMEIVKAIEDTRGADGQRGVDLVIEKSRDMGASWLSLTVMEWFWHFHKGYSFLMVSRKEDLVDSPGDPDSLFWKIDFIHKHLPRWLYPQLERRKLHFGNVANGSTIDGESTTTASGVGGRRTAMFIDEFSRIEEGYQLLAGTADTTRCRIFNFTPYGTNNAAYKLARRTDVRKLRLHWSEHPEKARGLYRYNDSTHQVDVLDKQFKFAPDFNFVMDGKLRSPWYDYECKRRANDREVAQMLDIDYQGSEYQFFDRTLIMELQRTYCCAAFWEGDVAFDGETGRPMHLVKIEGGPLKLWMNITAQGKPPVGVFVMGSDLGAGTGATNSCVSIVNVETGEKVGEYAHPYLRPEQMALRAVALGWLFKDEVDEPAEMAWETGGPGQVFGKAVMDLGYRHVYYRQAEKRIGRVYSDMPGWVPNADTRRILLDEYRTDLSSRVFLNRSTEALEECLYFVHMANGTVEHSSERSSEDPSGARVNHGDRTIADGLANKLRRMRGKRKTADHVEEAPVGSLAWRRGLAYHAEQAAEAWS